MADSEMWITADITNRGKLSGRKALWDLRSLSLQSLWDFLLTDEQRWQEVKELGPIISSFDDATLHPCHDSEGNKWPNYEIKKN